MTLHYNRPVTAPIMTQHHMMILSRVPDDRLLSVLRGAPKDLADDVLRSHWNLRAWAQRQDHLDMPSYPTADPDDAGDEPGESGGDWITTAEAARIMGVQPRTVTNAAIRGEIVAKQQAEGTSWQIDRDSAAQWRDARRRREDRAA